MSPTRLDDPLDYAEWLSRLVIDGGDSPSFVLGSLDLERLASAVLAMLPVVRAAEAYRDEISHRSVDWACAECAPHSDMLVAGFRCTSHALANAIDQLRKAGG